MAFNLLVIYEITYKASMVTSRRKLKEFEQWVRGVLQTYNDAAVARVANMQLFRLRDSFNV